MNRRIFELEVWEFLELLKQNNVPAPTEQKAEPKMLYSIKELAEFLKCSTVSAQKMKNEGRFPYAQTGRKCIFNGDEVLKAISHKMKGQRL